MGLPAPRPELLADDDDDDDFGLAKPPTDR